MRSLKQISNAIMREFWYERSEGLVSQLCLIDDAIVRVKDPKIEQRLEQRRQKASDQLQKADQKFWYHAARDGKP